jgi:4-hydroxy-tetrahydrodipicolinate synthase
MDLCILRERLKGIIVPVTTPFNEKFEIDYDALETLMKFYLDNGLKCFIAAGSTGECYVLTAEEHEKVVKTIVNTCKKYKDTFVLGACSHTSTAMSNKLADICQDAGVDGLLLTPPYYLNHSDMCPVHYRSVAKNHDIPLIIYHNKAMPEDMSLWEEFVKEPNILGVKFATHNIYMARQLISKYRDRLVIYGGGSMLQYLPMALHGSPGYVGGFCNFMPQIELDSIKLLT